MNHAAIAAAALLGIMGGACGGTNGTGGAGGTGTQSSTQVTATASGTTSASTTSATTASSSSASSTASSASSTASSSASTTASSTTATSSGTGGSVDVVEVDCATATIAQTIGTVNLMFMPDTATVNVGDVVRFDPTFNHTVLADDASFFVNAGAIKCFTFNVAKAYPFTCTYHPTMVGTLTVQ